MQANPITLPSILVHQSPPQYQTRDFTQDVICATEKNYCFPLKSKFKVDNKSLASSTKFTETSSSTVLFKSKATVVSLQTKKLLKDAKSGKVILTVDKGHLKISNVYKILRGEVKLI
jgi:hypothetical protein